MSGSPLGGGSGSANTPGGRPIHRPGLLAVLDRTARLTTVVAGPGAGKTALLTAWVADRPDRVRYPLRADDAALPVFLRGLADALHAALPEEGIDALRAVNIDDPEAAEGLAAVLSARSWTLARSGDGLGLAFDDLHVLPTGSASVRFVEALCRQAPAGLRLVLSSRLDLPFPVERLRAARQLVEIGARDLVFHDDETYQVLASALGDAAAADEL